MVPWFDLGHSCANLHHNTRSFVSEYNWLRYWISLIPHRDIRVTNAGCHQTYKNFIQARSFQVDLFDRQWSLWRASDSRGNLHVSKRENLGAKGAVITKLADVRYTSIGTKSIRSDCQLLLMTADGCWRSRS